MACRAPDLAGRGHARVFFSLLFAASAARMPWLYVKRQGIEAQRASCCSQWWSDSSVVHSQPVVEIHTPYI